MTKFVRLVVILLIFDIGFSRPTVDELEKEVDGVARNLFDSFNTTESTEGDQYKSDGRKYEPDSNTEIKSIPDTNVIKTKSKYDGIKSKDSEIVNNGSINNFAIAYNNTQIQYANNGTVGNKSEDNISQMDYQLENDAQKGINGSNSSLNIQNTQKQTEHFGNQFAHSNKTDKNDRVRKKDEKQNILQDNKLHDDNVNNYYDHSEKNLKTNTDHSISGISKENISLNPDRAENKHNVDDIDKLFQLEENNIESIHMVNDFKENEDIQKVNDVKDEQNIFDSDKELNFERIENQLIAKRSIKNNKNIKLYKRSLLIPAYVTNNYMSATMNPMEKLINAKDHPLSDHNSDLFEDELWRNRTLTNVLELLEKYQKNHNDKHPSNTHQLSEEIHPTLYPHLFYNYQTSIPHLKYHYTQSLEQQFTQAPHLNYNPSKPAFGNYHSAQTPSLSRNLQTTYKPIEIQTTPNPDLKYENSNSNQQDPIFNHFAKTPSPYTEHHTDNLIKRSTSEQVEKHSTQTPNHTNHVTPQTSHAIKHTTTSPVNEEILKIDDKYLQPTSKFENTTPINKISKKDNNGNIKSNLSNEEQNDPQNKKQSMKNKSRESNKELEYPSHTTEESLKKFSTEKSKSHQETNTTNNLQDQKSLSSDDKAIENKVNKNFEGMEQFSNRTGDNKSSEVTDLKSQKQMPNNTNQMDEDRLLGTIVSEVGNIHKADVFLTDAANNRILQRNYQRVYSPNSGFSPRPFTPGSRRIIHQRKFSVGPGSSHQKIINFGNKNILYRQEGFKSANGQHQILETIEELPENKDLLPSGKMSEIQDFPNIYSTNEQNLGQNKNKNMFPSLDQPKSNNINMNQQVINENQPSSNQNRESKVRNQDQKGNNEFISSVTNKTQNENVQAIQRNINHVNENKTTNHTSDVQNKETRAKQNDSINYQLNDPLDRNLINNGSTNHNARLREHFRDNANLTSSNSKLEKENVPQEQVVERPVLKNNNISNKYSSPKPDIMVARSGNHFNNAKFNSKQNYRIHNKLNNNQKRPITNTQNNINNDFTVLNYPNNGHYVHVSPNPIHNYHSYQSLYGPTNKPWNSYNYAFPTTPTNVALEKRKGVKPQNYYDKTNGNIINQVATEIGRQTELLQKSQESINSHFKNMPQTIQQQMQIQNNRNNNVHEIADKMANFAIKSIQPEISKINNAIPNISNQLFNTKMLHSGMNSHYKVTERNFAEKAKCDQNSKIHTHTDAIANPFIQESNFERNIQNTYRVTETPLTTFFTKMANYKFPKEIFDTVTEMQINQNLGNQQYQEATIQTSAKNKVNGESNVSPSLISNNYDNRKAVTNTQMHVSNLLNKNGFPITEAPHTKVNEANHQYSPINEFTVMQPSNNEEHQQDKGLDFSFPLHFNEDFETEFLLATMVTPLANTTKSDLWKQPHYYQYSKPMYANPTPNHRFLSNYNPSHGTYPGYNHPEQNLPVKPTVSIPVPKHYQDKVNVLDKDKDQRNKDIMYIPKNVGVKGINQNDVDKKSRMDIKSSAEVRNQKPNQNNAILSSNSPTERSILKHTGSNSKKTTIPEIDPALAFFVTTPSYYPEWKRLYGTLNYPNSATKSSLEIKPQIIYHGTPVPDNEITHYDDPNLKSILERLKIKSKADINETVGKDFDKGLLTSLHNMARKIISNNSPNEEIHVTPMKHNNQRIYYPNDIQDMHKVTPDLHKQTSISCSCSEKIKYTQSISNNGLVMETPHLSPSAMINKPSNKHPYLKPNNEGMYQNSIELNQHFGNNYREHFLHHPDIQGGNFRHPYDLIQQNVRPTKAGPIHHHTDILQQHIEPYNHPLYGIQKQKGSVKKQEALINPMEHIWLDGSNSHIRNNKNYGKYINDRNFNNPSEQIDKIISGHPSDQKEKEKQNWNKQENTIKQEVPKTISPPLSGQFTGNHFKEQGSNGGALINSGLVLPINLLNLNPTKPSETQHKILPVSVTTDRNHYKENMKGGNNKIDGVLSKDHVHNQRENVQNSLIKPPGSFSQTERNFKPATQKPAKYDSLINVPITVPISILNSVPTRNNSSINNRQENILIGANSSPSRQQPNNSIVFGEKQRQANSGNMGSLGNQFPKSWHPNRLHQFQGYQQYVALAPPLPPPPIPPPMLPAHFLGQPSSDTDTLINQGLKNPKKSQNYDQAKSSNSVQPSSDSQALINLSLNVPINVAQINDRQQNPHKNTNTDLRKTSNEKNQNKSQEQGPATKENNKFKLHEQHKFEDEGYYKNQHQGYSQTKQPIITLNTEATNVIKDRTEMNQYPTQIDITEKYSNQQSSNGNFGFDNRQNQNMFNQNQKYNNIQNSKNDQEPKHSKQVLTPTYSQVVSQNSEPLINLPIQVPINVITKSDQSLHEKPIDVTNPPESKKYPYTTENNNEINKYGEQLQDQSNFMDPQKVEHFKSQKYVGDQDEKSKNYPEHKNRFQQFQGYQQPISTPSYQRPDHLINLGLGLPVSILNLNKNQPSVLNKPTSQFKHFESNIDVTLSPEEQIHNYNQINNKPGPISNDQQDTNFRSEPPKYEQQPNNQMNFHGKVKEPENFGGDNIKNRPIYNEQYLVSTSRPANHNSENKSHNHNIDIKNNAQHSYATNSLGKYKYPNILGYNPTIVAPMQFQSVKPGNALINTGINIPANLLHSRGSNVPHLHQQQATKNVVDTTVSMDITEGPDPKNKQITQDVERKHINQGKYIFHNEGDNENLKDRNKESEGEDKEIDHQLKQKMFSEENEPVYEGQILNKDNYTSSGTNNHQYQQIDITEHPNKVPNFDSNNHLNNLDLINRSSANLMKKQTYQSNSQNGLYSPHQYIDITESTRDVSNPINENDRPYNKSSEYSYNEKYNSENITKTHQHTERSVLDFTSFNDKLDDYENSEKVNIQIDITENPNKKQDYIRGFDKSNSRIGYNVTDENTNHLKNSLSSTISDSAPLTWSLPPSEFRTSQFQSYPENSANSNEDYGNTNKKIYQEDLTDDDSYKIDNQESRHFHTRKNISKKLEHSNAQISETSQDDLKHAANINQVTWSIPNPQDVSTFVRYTNNDEMITWSIPKTTTQPNYATEAQTKKNGIKQILQSLTERSPPAVIQAKIPKRAENPNLFQLSFLNTSKPPKSQRKDDWNLFNTFTEPTTLRTITEKWNPLADETKEKTKPNIWSLFQNFITPKPTTEKPKSFIREIMDSFTNLPNKGTKTSSAQLNSFRNVNDMNFQQKERLPVEYNIEHLSSKTRTNENHQLNNIRYPGWKNNINTLVGNLGSNQNIGDYINSNQYIETTSRSQPITWSLPPEFIPESAKTSSKQGRIKAPPKIKLREPQEFLENDGFGTIEKPELIRPNNMPDNVGYYQKDYNTPITLRPGEYYRRQYQYLNSTPRPIRHNIAYQQPSRNNFQNQHKNTLSRLQILPEYPSKIQQPTNMKHSHDEQFQAYIPEGHMFSRKQSYVPSHPNLHHLSKNPTVIDPVPHFPRPYEYASSTHNPLGQSMVMKNKNELNPSYFRKQPSMSYFDHKQASPVPQLFSTEHPYLYPRARIDKFTENPIKNHYIGHVKHPIYNIPNPYHHVQSMNIDQTETAIEATRSYIKENEDFYPTPSISPGDKLNEELFFEPFGSGFTFFVAPATPHQPLKKESEETIDFFNDDIPMMKSLLKNSNDDEGKQPLQDLINKLMKHDNTRIHSLSTRNVHTGETQNQQRKYPSQFASPKPLPQPPINNQLRKVSISKPLRFNQSIPPRSGLDAMEILSPFFYLVSIAKHKNATHNQALSNVEDRQIIMKSTRKHPILKHVDYTHTSNLEDVTMRMHQQHQNPSYNENETTSNKKSRGHHQNQQLSNTDLRRIANKASALHNQQQQRRSSVEAFELNQPYTNNQKEKSQSNAKLSKTIKSSISHQNPLTVKDLNTQNNLIEKNHRPFYHNQQQQFPSTVQDMWILKNQIDTQTQKMYKDSKLGFKLNTGQNQLVNLNENNKLLSQNSEISNKQPAVYANHQQIISNVENRFKPFAKFGNSFFPILPAEKYNLLRQRFSSQEDQAALIMNKELQENAQRNPLLTYDEFIPNQEQIKVVNTVDKSEEFDVNDKLVSNNIENNNQITIKTNLESIKNFLNHINDKNIGQVPYLDKKIDLQYVKTSTTGYQVTVSSSTQSTPIITEGSPDIASENNTTDRSLELTDRNISSLKSNKTTTKMPTSNNIIQEKLLSRNNTEIENKKKLVSSDLDSIETSIEDPLKHLLVQYSKYLRHYKKNPRKKPSSEEEYYVDSDSFENYRRRLNNRKWRSKFDKVYRGTNGPDEDEISKIIKSAERKIRMKYYSRSRSLPQNTFNAKHNNFRNNYFKNFRKPSKLYDDIMIPDSTYEDYVSGDDFKEKFFNKHLLPYDDMDEHHDKMVSRKDRHRPDEHKTLAKLSSESYIRARPNELRRVSVTPEEYTIDSSDIRRKELPEKDSTFITKVNNLPPIKPPVRKISPEKSLRPHEFQGIGRINSINSIKEKIENFKRIAKINSSKPKELVRFLTPAPDTVQGIVRSNVLRPEDIIGQANQGIGVENTVSSSPEGFLKIKTKTPGVFKQIDDKQSNIFLVTSGLMIPKMEQSGSETTISMNHLKTELQRIANIKNSKTTSDDIHKIVTNNDTPVINQGETKEILETVTPNAKDKLLETNANSNKKGAIYNSILENNNKSVTINMQKTMTEKQNVSFPLTKLSTRDYNKTSEGSVDTQNSEKLRKNKEDASVIENSKSKNIIKSTSTIPQKNVTVQNKLSEESDYSSSMENTKRKNSITKSPEKGSSNLEYEYFSSESLEETGRNGKNKKDKLKTLNINVKSEESYETRQNTTTTDKMDRRRKSKSKHNTESNMETSTNLVSTDTVELKNDKDVNKRILKSKHVKHSKHNEEKESNSNKHKSEENESEEKNRSRKYKSKLKVKEESKENIDEIKSYKHKSKIKSKQNAENKTEEEGEIVKSHKYRSKHKSRLKEDSTADIVGKEGIEHEKDVLPHKHRTKSNLRLMHESTEEIKPHKLKSKIKGEAESEELIRSQKSKKIKSKYSSEHHENIKLHRNRSKLKTPKSAEEMENYSENTIGGPISWKSKEETKHKRRSKSRHKEESSHEYAVGGGGGVYFSEEHSKERTHRSRTKHKHSGSNELHRRQNIYVNDELDVNDEDTAPEVGGIIQFHHKHKKHRKHERTQNTENKRHKDHKYKVEEPDVNHSDTDNGIGNIHSVDSYEQQRSKTGTHKSDESSDRRHRGKHRRDKNHGNGKS